MQSQSWPGKKIIPAGLFPRQLKDTCCAGRGSRVACLPPIDNRSQYSAGGNYYSRTGDPAAAFTVLNKIKVGDEVELFGQNNNDNSDMPF